jgi:hypothetical protein
MVLCRLVSDCDRRARHSPIRFDTFVTQTIVCGASEAEGEEEAYQVELTPGAFRAALGSRLGLLVQVDGQATIARFERVTCDFIERRER